LRAVTKIEFIGPEGKCAIFTAEKDIVRLVSCIGIPEEDLEPSIYRQIEEYVSGPAAAVGNLFISKEAVNIVQYASKQPETVSCRYVIVPMKTLNGLVGVLFLLLKPGMELAKDETELLLSVGNQVANAIENAKHYEEVETASLHDSLTGLANRRFLEIELNKNFESARRYRERLSAIMLDIDHFKHYNDTKGHIAGDKILIKLAKILLRETRTPDNVFRYGGEEFLIILPKTDLAKAHDVAERLRGVVEAEMEITISLGVATYQDNMTDSERLVSFADFALYRAKREGRNRVVAVD
jgi:diguanylate cyclase (GGDEF)-like protein